MLSPFPGFLTFTTCFNSVLTVWPDVQIVKKLTITEVGGEGAKERLIPGMCLPTIEG
jgi:hypothetical protein